ncbi:MAG: hypothetical protein ACTSQE_16335 [Candidatus Heimdallarchaeaceae archaeon]
MAPIKEEWLIPLGGICIAIAVILDRFLLIEIPIVDFLVGVFAGMDLVLNFFGLVKRRGKLNS